MDFVEFLQGLAPEGETLLVARQKPVMREGAQATHADGTPKYTWPAFLPSKKRPEGAWYGNTGSFIIDRFKEGQPSASAANCEYVLVLMLDDVGTKAREPNLAPTWIMETSEGSFQWGYAFSDQPTKGEFTAAMVAIAAAGYTDPVRQTPCGISACPAASTSSRDAVSLRPGLWRSTPPASLPCLRYARPWVSHQRRPTRRCKKPYGCATPARITCWPG